uniref:glutathione S-transferase D4-like n=1 Tax=Styela clava TaxID=7725 RepID=UPI001939C939|nr:glutathione S-transferase D4-like [Styela clava]
MSDLHFYYMDKSSTSRGVWTVLELLELKYTEHYIDLINGEHKTESYAKINPRQLVPALIDGELHLSESRVIATYLVSKYGTQCGQQQLYPTDVEKRALVDKHLYIGLDVSDAIGAFVNIHDVMLAGGQTNSKKLTDVEKFLILIESNLTESPYVALKHLTLADIFYYIAIQLLTLTNWDYWNKYPNILEWKKKVEAIPCYKKTLGSPVDDFRIVYQKALEKNQRTSKEEKNECISINANL